MVVATGAGSSSEEPGSSEPATARRLPASRMDSTESGRSGCNKPCCGRDVVDQHRCPFERSRQRLSDSPTASALPVEAEGGGETIKPTGIIRIGTVAHLGVADDRGYGELDLPGERVGVDHQPRLGWLRSRL